MRLKINVNSRLRAIYMEYNIYDTMTFNFSSSSLVVQPSPPPPTHTQLHLHQLHGRWGTWDGDGIYIGAMCWVRIRLARISWFQSRCLYSLAVVSRVTFLYWSLIDWKSIHTRYSLWNFIIFREREVLLRIGSMTNTDEKFYHSLSGDKQEDEVSLYNEFFSFFLLICDESTILMTYI